MTETLTKEEYRSEVRSLAERVEARARDSMKNGHTERAMFAAIGSHASEIVEEHPWIEGGSPGRHGQIIGHSIRDTGEYVEWRDRMLPDPGQEPIDALQQLAYLCMTPDVMGPAMDSVEDDGNG